MDLRVRERLIGALVLVAIVVAFVPAILKGRGPGPEEPTDAQMRRVEVPIGDPQAAAGDAGLVPEPSLPAVLPPASPGQRQAEPEHSAAGLPPPSSVDAPPPNPPPAKAAAMPAQPAAKPVAPPQAAWAVQLGAYSSRDKADQFVADLRKRGFAAFVLEYRASGKVLYRVRVGPEQDRARAEAVAARLAKEGFQPVVARHP